MHSNRARNQACLLRLMAKSKSSTRTAFTYRLPRRSETNRHGPERNRNPEHAGYRKRHLRCTWGRRELAEKEREAFDTTLADRAGKRELAGKLQTMIDAAGRGGASRASQAAKKSSAFAAERNGLVGRRGLMRARAVSCRPALDDTLSRPTFDRPPAILIGTRRPGLSPTLGKSPANAPAGAAAPGTSPGCPACPCPPRCARRRSCRSRPIPRAPSSRRPDRRCARRGRASRTRAGRGRA